MTKIFHFVDYYTHSYVIEAETPEEARQLAAKYDLNINQLFYDSTELVHSEEVPAVKQKQL